MSTPIPMPEPVPVRERLVALDVVRGIALLGILLMNMEAFVGPMNIALEGLDPSLRGADRVVDALILILVQGKFYALFSLLFGMGFAVMLQRAGDAFTRVYVRRTLALLVIGLAHMLLVWSGDILTSYAVVALLMLAVFTRVPVRHLPWLGVAIYLLPSLLTLALGAVGSLAQMSPEGARAMAEAMAPAGTLWEQQTQMQREAYGAGSYAQATVQRLRDAATMLTYLMIYGPMILGLFVLGSWFVRSGAIADPAAHARTFARLRLVALPVGLAMVVTAFVLMPTLDIARIDMTMGIATLLSMGGALLMALGYLAWILRGLSAPSLRPALLRVAPAGRMALTNYLLQSVICTLVFYGYGLGWYEALPRAWQPVFVVALWLLQVAWSTWWLRRHAFGPAEWAWRGLTYGRLPALRLRPA